MEPLEYSRYARQLVAARPELREELERSLREPRAPGHDAEIKEYFKRLSR